MSKIIRQTALSGLFGSKRFIVAVCGAIAMVLGALSAGASVFVPPSTAEGREHAARSSVFTERQNSNDANDKDSGGSAFTQQHTLVPDTWAQPETADKSSAKATPKVKTGLGIQFGPVTINNSAGISLGALQIQVDASVIEPLVNMSAEVASPTEMPATETPEVEPPPDAPPEALAEERANLQPDAYSVPADAAVQP